MANEQDDLALLLQEALGAMDAQNRQNIELFEENKKISERLAQLLAATQSAETTVTRARTRVEVSLQTRNRVHSVYASLQDRNEGWDFAKRLMGDFYASINYTDCSHPRFCSPENQSVVGKLCQEIKSTHPGTTESEITEACRVYFKSLKDDKHRKDKGKHHMHRRSLKLQRRIKQKLQRRKNTLQEAGPELHWSSTHKSRVKSLLQEEYMSSETSADESDSDSYAFKVRKLAWLKRRYRKAFHELDTVHSKKMSKRSKGMTRPRVASKYASQRHVPSTVPSWAISEQATSPDSASPLNTSISSQSSSTDNI